MTEFEKKVEEFTNTYWIDVYGVGYWKKNNKPFLFDRLDGLIKYIFGIDFHIDAKYNNNMYFMQLLYNYVVLDWNIILTLILRDKMPIKLDIVGDDQTGRLLISIKDLSADDIRILDKYAYQFGITLNYDYHNERVSLNDSFSYEPVNLFYKNVKGDKCYITFSNNDIHEAIKKYQSLFVESEKIIERFTATDNVFHTDLSIDTDITDDISKHRYYCRWHKSTKIETLKDIHTIYKLMHNKHE